MRIGIDGRWISRPVGLGRFSFNLIQSLARIDRKNSYVIYVRSLDDASRIPNQRNFRAVTVGWWPYPVAEQLILPRLIARDKLDIFHATLGTAPLLPIPAKLVVTVADAMFAMPRSIVPGRKSLYQRLGGMYRRIVVPRVYRRADATATISEKSKKDLEKYLNSGVRTKVIYLAAGDEFRPGLADKKTLKRFNLPDKFIFSLAGVDPRKNTEELIDSYRESGMTLPLVLAGEVNADLEARINSPELLNRVIYLGRVSQEELSSLYRAAEMFIFPSLYEAFGLPLLEAMASGTPVLALDTGANQEIAGVGALIVPPDSLASGIKNLATDKVLRVKLSNRGLTRAREFSWRKTAQGYLTLYKRVHS